jgi:ferritin-like metal-binding protein YciE
MTDMDERINQWLRDAHAMEEQAEQILHGQSERIENYPEIKALMLQHLEETRLQSKRLEECLERRGTSASGLKNMAGKITATLQNLSGMFVGDEVVKSILAVYTFEHMEIASYRILIAACDTAGDPETKRVLEEICREEEAMAERLSQSMTDVTRGYLIREEAELDEAKR